MGAANIAMNAESADAPLTGGKRATPAKDLKLPKTFAQYMEEHANLRTVVEEGKGKLMWDRPIPPEALAGLEALSKDFQANLGKIIHDIYATANGIFRDLPQGDHKKRPSTGSPPKPSCASFPQPLSLKWNS